MLVPEWDIFDCGSGCDRLLRVEAAAAAELNSVIFGAMAVVATTPWIPLPEGRSTQLL